MGTQLTSQVEKTRHYLMQCIKTMPVGAPIPPVSEIRKSLGVSQISVQKAYDVLEAQGRIVRKPRKGIFVSDRTKTGEFAILVLPELLHPAASPYYSLVCSALVEEVHLRRPDVNVKMHFGRLSPSGRFYAPPEIIHAGPSAKLRGVFTFYYPLFGPDEKNVSLDVPVVTLRGTRPAPGEYSVSFDGTGSIRQCMAAMVAAGCRSVGVLGTISRYGDEPCFVQTVIEAAQAERLELRDEWLPVSTCGSTVTDQLGYEQFLNLWRSPDKPDGLIVMDDVVCRGVLRACLQLGVDLPGEVQLITRANKHVNIPYHKPLTRLEFDPQEQAKHAVEMVIRLLRGRRPKVSHVVVPGRLAPGETTRVENDQKRP